MTALILSLVVLAGQQAEPKDWNQIERSSPLVDRDAAPASGQVESELSPLRLIAWTAVVLGIMVALFFVARRYMVKGIRIGTDEMIRVVARSRLTPSLEVLVVDVGPKRLILGAGKEGLTKLDELPPAVETKTFEGVLGKLEGAGGTLPDAVEQGVGGTSPS